eukprot:4377554-Heterocapsa_arctica.AAC.1
MASRAPLLPRRARKGHREGHGGGADRVHRRQTSASTCRRQRTPGLRWTRISRVWCETLGQGR